MKLIKNQTFDEERALYGLRDVTVEDCTFAGAADGESALKESRGVAVHGCTFALRYPFWHCHNFTVDRSRMTETCRAPLWYAADGEIADCEITGVKALRECDRVALRGVTAKSAEFGWRCRDISLDGCKMESEYIFFESENVRFQNSELTGKYSFQYVRGLTITDSSLNTKDSFWHAKDVLVENSTVRGEYLGWYSENLTMKNCTIIGTQPFCYCENLKLINCELVDCALAFEYSTVDAELRGHVVSIKNPLAGRITADSVGEIIREGAVYDCRGEIVIRK